MSGLRHTPGPWRADREDDVLTVHGDRVAAVYGEEVDIQQANARLISAAPEMLAALSLAVEEIEKLRHYVSGPVAAAAYKVGQGCRAAIAKAQDQSS